MSGKDLCKGRHLKIEDRLIIEYGLDQNYTLKEITEIVKKARLLSLKRLSEIDFLKQVNEKEMICNHVNTEKVVLRRTYVIVAVVSNVRNVDL